ncbi:MAG: CDP-alcohol phosphatidyltransferase family protein [Bacteroidia bacterium]|nr:CDP-alcohol phosphatidyltransferase family protein [Bacteroidia bacterium]MDW8235474.1 CDP-alcohol phosphatidyltransferase family protein [Bacteroidia bacterium]
MPSIGLRWLPNLFTLTNLLLGLIAIALAYERAWNWMGLAIGLALLCDWIDGLLARLLRAEGPIGKELDTLADLVTFGGVPAFALYNYVRPLVKSLPYGEELRFWMVVVPFGLPLLAAWRLARYNVQGMENPLFFTGLPTPAQGVFWIGWLLSEPKGLWLHPVVWIILTLTVGGLMVSRIPCLALKTPRALPWLAALIVMAVPVLGLPPDWRMPALLLIYVLGSQVVVLLTKDNTRS